MASKIINKYQKDLERVKESGVVNMGDFEISLPTTNQEDRYHYVMREISKSVSLSQLQTCARLKDLYCMQNKENPKAPLMKASLEGMITMREYQLSKK